MKPPIQDQWADRRAHRKPEQREGEVFRRPEGIGRARQRRRHRLHAAGQRHPRRTDGIRGGAARPATLAGATGGETYVVMAGARFLLGALKSMFKIVKMEAKVSSEDKATVLPTQQLRTWLTKQY